MVGQRLAGLVLNGHTLTCRSATSRYRVRSETSKKAVYLRTLARIAGEPDASGLQCQVQPDFVAAHEPQHERRVEA
jgi:Mrp family chromosome partitioning ATPase